MNKESGALSNLPFEKSLLGLILIGDQVALTQMMLLMKEEYFYDERHKVIFRAITRITKLAPSNATHDIKVSSKIVINVLENDKLIDKAGGYDYINKLVLLAGSSNQVDTYMKSIIECYDKNQLFKIVNEALEHIFTNKETTTDHVIGEISQRIATFSSQSQKNEFERGRESLINVLGSLLNGKDRTSGLKTNLIELDLMLNGLNPGDLVILAARPSVGKTAFAVNMIKEFTNQGKKVAFFSLEMPRDQILYRMLANQCSIDLNKFKNPSAMGDMDLNKLNRSINDKFWENLYIDDTPSLGITDLVWKAKKLNNKTKIDAIVIDYLQYIRYDVSEKKGRDRHLEVSHISQQLKQLARELEIPVISLAQLSRKAEENQNSVPLLSHLRESGSIEQDADIIMFLSRESYQNYGDNPEEAPAEPVDSYHKPTKVSVAKNRNGETGIATVIFEPRYSRFTSFDASHIGEKK